ncbi:DUF4913 domain-containing protein [Nocardia brasiliensis]|uniref:DUF4913 domain-containing protein n=1 Tax=Nocardia brasiliensis TaxID=37326 RepID=UPI00189553DE|nr:DUF4913 domain-containing protein [Nocardia brasiliensis]MBF6548883.1 DUF4913 domain-containing protein [Nocardia brasiliensis]
MTDTLNTNNHASARAAGSAAAQAISGIELGALLDTAVRQAVGAQFAAAARSIATEVVGAFLTDEVRAQMTETAAHEAELALNPSVVVSAADDQDEQDEDEQPRLQYPTVQDFVEQWVSEVYRREVLERNVESRRRWCPQWWKHGEARARLGALWLAFEALRQGETVEQSLFWLVHLDPHMTRLLDPEGPFKYCSPNEGHHGLLAALPVVPAPANYSSSDVDTETEHPSGLVIPTGPARRRVLIAQFP